MSFNRYRIIFILIFMLASDGTRNGGMASDTGTTMQQQQQPPTNEMENAQSDNKGGRALFPRMEYTNEWTPVGRGGDPLKDPTFDYMPPMLDRVRYWAEGTSNKNKNDILLLGVPSKKLQQQQQQQQHAGKKEKYTYGPIKRNFFSMPYQSHFSAPHHYQQQQQQPPQQQQYHPQRLMPPHRMHVTSDPHAMMSTLHYNHHRPPPPSTWNSNNVHHTEVRQESSIHQKTAARPMPTTTAPTRYPSTHFLPTIPPASTAEHSSSTPTSAMSFVPSKSEATLTTAMNGQRQQQQQHVSRETTKPLLQSILQTEAAAPFSFTMKPSSIYQIEYTSNIYNPEAINSMATSSSSAVASTTTSTTTTTAFVPPTKPSVRPMMPIKHTTATTATRMTISSAERDEQKHYVQPDVHSAWPVYNLIIEGHSKVKNYGLKNDDPLAASMPKIRPVQAKENPIVERITDDGDAGAEYKAKQKSTMESLLSLLDGSFGNFLHEEERAVTASGKRKTRSVARDDTSVNNRQESVVGVSFQVDERPQVYRRGTVISETLWPFQNADTSRSR